MCQCQQLANSAVLVCVLRFNMVRTKFTSIVRLHLGKNYTKFLTKYSTILAIQWALQRQYKDKSNMLFALNECSFCVVKILCQIIPEAKIGHKFHENLM